MLRGREIVKRLRATGEHPGSLKFREMLSQEALETLQENGMAIAKTRLSKGVPKSIQQAVVSQQDDGSLRCFGRTSGDHCRHIATPLADGFRFLENIRLKKRLDHPPTAPARKTGAEFAEDGLQRMVAVRQPYDLA